VAAALIPARNYHDRSGLLPALASAAETADVLEHVTIDS